MTGQWWQHRYGSLGATTETSELNNYSQLIYTAYCSVMILIATDQPTDVEITGDFLGIIERLMGVSLEFGPICFGPRADSDCLTVYNRSYWLVHISHDRFENITRVLFSTHRRSAVATLDRLGDRRCQYRLRRFLLLPCRLPMWGPLEVLSA